jgi:hypothetical protein
MMKRKEGEAEEVDNKPMFPFRLGVFVSPKVSIRKIKASIIITFNFYVIVVRISYTQLTKISINHLII